MNLIRNEKGLTLIEILVSITILSIIFLSIMRFFPQMGLMNKQNQDKTQAISTAKQVLVQWKNDSRVKNFFVTPTKSVISEYDRLDGDYYIFKPNGGLVNIKIKKTPSNSSRFTNSNLIIVQILNNNGKVVSETFGYINR
ncbi:PulJ/GspJ family protein [Bacillus salipaludis]|uniref:Prepilin-type N-terminal cleavage/methylation domain-containing protein n=1 Tax=Bacillus salipaludis TaxID=2547811 RepID=A0AA90TET3_9BACI|nr:prepilin-type N-terminal cleavage/methylation domain-containing protein [Bacillus salipaludis]MDQ6599832.1 prepilin-type N-terminal cleavage/methylation domain-containing protein [Bacillus salipaludis]